MTRRARHASARRRRGLVILAVLVVVSMAALIGSTILLRADAGTAGARGSLRRAESRAAAWSGVQAVMARLAQQRDDLLAGGAPVLPEGWAFPVESAGGRLVFRVVPDDDGLPAASENARLDVNTATAEMLATLPGVGEALAQRIVEQRPEGGYESVESLARVEGIDRGMLHEGGAERDDAASEPVGEGELPALADLLTVWSFDPNVQGLGAGGDTIGTRRVPIPKAWSDRLGRALERRLGDGGMYQISTLATRGAQPDSVSAFVNALRGTGVPGVPGDEWNALLDIFTPYDATHRRGLVDMNRASAEALAAVPGIDEETAHAIVDARDRTPLESRGSIAWAVEAGVMSQESLIQAGDWLTARSTQWRVRVEGGFEAPADDAGVVAAPATLLDRVVYEAVIDVSTRRPRLASLREITGLRESLALDAGREDAPESIAEIVGENLLDEAALLDTPEEPEFTRLRQRPPRLTTVDESDTIDAAPPDGAAPEDATASDDAPGAAAGRTGRWTRGGGS